MGDVHMIIMTFNLSGINNEACFPKYYAGIHLKPAEFCISRLSPMQLENVKKMPSLLFRCCLENKRYRNVWFRSIYISRP